MSRMVLKRVSLGLIALIVVVLGGAAGCTDATVFREASADSLKTGVTSIATGLIDGFFAVFDGNDNTAG